ncbi:MAG: hypothetical protein KJ583_00710 [Nanoarchaeota archaeon]|nr:hypothetical protein [Nanoarchaeota archaeon]MBU1269626.1 hypothetical protein [Nanoarchaeota archaeon]MBU1603810.1 hypothetical protein [Nanoarchaeota archaeon]MBU2443380.1 hypothetical protein [Nanoarchaeota archaeon]
MNKHIIRIILITITIYIITGIFSWSILPLSQQYSAGYPVWWGFRYNLPFFLFSGVIYGIIEAIIFLLKKKW